MLFGGSAVDPRWTRHLDSCPRCRSEFEAMSQLRQLLRDLPPAESPPVSACPERVDWDEFVAGRIQGQRACEMADHAVDCELCGAFVVAVTDALPAIASATPKPGRRGQVVWRYAAAAALVVALAGATTYYWRGQSEPPLALLARAYSEDRPFQARYLGAGFGEFRQRRGADHGANAALASAEEQIERAAGAIQARPEWLRAKAEAELLNWRCEEAIRLLKRSLDLAPDSRESQFDLALAYFLLGEAKQERTYHGVAADRFETLLKANPLHPEALFNRALALQRLQRHREAALAWRTYLRIDPGGGWSGEARQHLAEVEDTGAR